MCLDNSANVFGVAIADWSLADCTGSGNHGFAEYCRSQNGKESEPAIGNRHPLPRRWDLNPRLLLNLPHFFDHVLDLRFDGPAGGLAEAAVSGEVEAAADGKRSVPEIVIGAADTAFCFQRRLGLIRQIHNMTEAWLHRSPFRNTRHSRPSRRHSSTNSPGDSVLKANRS